MRQFLLLPLVALAVNPDPVYDFWDKVNNQHTFHFPPAWLNEDQNEIHFYAYASEVDGTEAVYAFWEEANKQHNFHFAPAWDGEAPDDNPLYYAYRTQTSSTEQIFAWWDDANKQHTFHFEPAWEHGGHGERKGDPVFFAYKTPPGVAEEDHHTVNKVYAFWDGMNKQHTFHFPPAWKHGDQVETQKGHVFSAYTGQAEGTEPVYDWWDDGNKQHTFHFDPAWDGETKGTEREPFYAYRTAINANLTGVYDFWDSENKQHTFHFPPAWPNEVQKQIQFYAYKDNTAAWAPPTPAPTPEVTTKAVAEPVSRAFGFGNTETSIDNTEAWLEKCTAALHDHGIECTEIQENEGIIEVMMSGPEDTLETLKTVDGWEAAGVQLDELGDIMEGYQPAAMGQGGGAPSVGAEGDEENSTASSTVSTPMAACAAGVACAALML